MTFIDAYIENRLDARHLPTKDVDWSLGESGKPSVSYFGRFDDVMIRKASARLFTFFSHRRSTNHLFSNRNSNAKVYT